MLFPPFDDSGDKPSKPRGVAIPWYWFRRWLQRMHAEATAEQEHKLDAIVLEDRIMYSASPIFAFVDPVGQALDSSMDASMNGLEDLVEQYSQAILGEAPVVPPPNEEIESTTTSDQTDASDPSATSDPSSTSDSTEPSELTDPPSIPESSETAADSPIDNRDERFGRLFYNAFLAPPSELNTAETLDDPTARHELVILQEGLYDLDEMIADITGNAGDDRHFDFLVLSRLESGFDQIEAYLSQYQDLDAIHIVSHGSDGMMQLGGSWLTASNIEQHQSQLQAWGMSLSQSGDILIYGCDVAAGPEGQEFINTVARLTGADVAASMNNTGDISRGGDWSLEYVSGIGVQPLEENPLNNSVMTGWKPVATIETQVAFGLQLQQSYGGLLATVTVTTATDNNDSGITAGNGTHTITWLNANRGADNQISLREAIIAANNTAVRINQFQYCGNGVHTINIDPPCRFRTLLRSTLRPTTASHPKATVRQLFSMEQQLHRDGFVLTSTADGNDDSRFVIRDFSGDGIEIQANSNGNTIVGNYIGRFDATGIESVGNANTGVGIRILGANNIIGGTSSLDRNLVSGNDSHGIYITEGASATSNTVLGNYIGTTITGLVDLGNSLNGYSSTRVHRTTRLAVLSCISKRHLRK